MNSTKEVLGKTVLLKGQGYFSDFRLNSILKTIRDLGVKTDSIVCNEVYIVLFKDELKNIKEKEITTLNVILNSNKDQSFSKENCFLITPRKGTISPWSSKAQDIIKNSGINLPEVDPFEPKVNVLFWIFNGNETDLDNPVLLFVIK